MDAFQTADAALLADPNISASVVYSRLASGAVAALGPITVSATVFTGGEFASPDGDIYGNVGLKISSIPGGPKKGDFIAIAGVSYIVQLIFADIQGDWADLKIRKPK